MEIVFFLARPEQARGVASSDDLPGEPAAEPVEADGPDALAGLAAALELEGPAVRPLRDATCRSYPVWRLARPLCERLARLSDAEIDAAAERWRPRADADLHERAIKIGTRKVGAAEPRHRLIQGEVGLLALGESRDGRLDPFG